MLVYRKCFWNLVLYDNKRDILLSDMTLNGTHCIIRSSESTCFTHAQNTSTRNRDLPQGYSGQTHLSHDILVSIAA